MRYPVFSYDDGTEVTASKPDARGNIMLYIEKFDRDSDSFINATVSLPNLSIVSSNGYDKKDLEEMLEEYAEVKEDIIDYVMEKVKKSA
jgi:hypothetical protein